MLRPLSTCIYPVSKLPCQEEKTDTPRESNVDNIQSYQIEGAVEADGRGPSIWDTFCKIPGKIADGTSGDVACDSYHRTAEDIALLKQCGAKAYRFSISWSRVIPLGGRQDSINQKGLNHYVKLVDDLIAAQIVPMVTLYHWDLPEALDKRYGGLLNKAEFVADYAHYARIMFQALPKVKHWITFNEPWCSSILAYNIGVFAPGHTSDRNKSAIGDSSREPWIVGHSLLVAHGAAVDIYRREFAPHTHGKIGITLNGDWAEPFDPNSAADIAACERKLEFAISWFADPIYLGKYPDSMISQLGDRLPKWTPEDIALVHGSNDFYGMNHYCGEYIRDLSNHHQVTENGTTNSEDNDFLGRLSVLSHNIAGDPIGPETQSPWLRPYAPGFRKLLKWLSHRYGRPAIFVTENGTSIKGEGLDPVNNNTNSSHNSREKILNDEFRCTYFRDYITALTEAVALDGVDVRGYFAWSLMDNFEWADGYATRFGVTYVDYADDQKRYVKKSAGVVRELFETFIKEE